MPTGLFEGDIAGVANGELVTVPANHFDNQFQIFLVIISAAKRKTG